MMREEESRINDNGKRENKRNGGMKEMDEILR